MSSSESSPTARVPRSEWIWAAVVLALAACFYFWTATSAGSPRVIGLEKDDLYNRLAEGFLSGRLGFVEAPNPALAQLADPWDPAQNGPLRQFHDVSYYRGRYYLYFGAAPALLLLAPWKAVTGTFLAQNVAVAVFALVGAAAGILLLIQLRRRHFPGVPAWISGLGMLALAFGNMVPVLLRRPVYYELAIASAYAFAMIALLALKLALDATTTRRRWLVVAGLAYGLAIASRPNYLFGAVILLAPLLPAWRQHRAGGRSDWWAPVPDVIAGLVPLAVIIAGLLAYNLARFGDMLEFGTRYMFSGMNPQKDIVTSFSFLPINAWFYLLAPANLSIYFPFFQVIDIPWFKFPLGYSGQENVYGILPNLPFFWLVWLTWRWWRRETAADATGIHDWVTATFALVLLNVLVLSRIGGAANRYMVDFLPPLVPVACLGVFMLEVGAVGWRRLAGRVFWMGALGWTVVFNLLVSLQHNELLRFHNPTTYRSLAETFNRVPSLLGLPSSKDTGPLRIRLQFPSDRTGKLEPVVVTGVSFRADFLYVFYTDAGHIQFGFEHTSYGGTMTKPPVAVDYGAEHILEVEMGSLYPPEEHPYFAGVAVGDITRRKRTLRVTLDGREVLAGQFDFYDSSPGAVAVGFNPVQDAFGRRFTGRMLGSERLAAPPVR